MSNRRANFRNFLICVSYQYVSLEIGVLSEIHLKVKIAL
jgi:hypothetical protein